ncbi:uncharacterized protein LOC113370448 isoform X1 [Ctenocephalides felis]|uniref:uncharacterized protein LOC113370448 isoform X1 n=1 Tax=Ctenocephalides felis TaxID=7515 RepID=UPI000E6E2403|nr:uncharacterized protein LOC113370448 isoform X1 [Ctenocephalides felis]
MKVLLCFLIALAVTKCDSYMEAFDNDLWKFIPNELAKSESRSEPIAANINDILDTIMDDIGFFFSDKNLDPLAMPDIKEGFSAKPALITYHGELELTNGTLSDLSTVSRAGNATLHYNNKLLRLSLGLKFDSLKLDYKYLAKIMNIGPKGNVVAKIRGTEIFLDVIADLHDFTIYLQHFEVPQLKKIRVHLRGNILTDWLVNALSRVTTTIFRDVIRIVVEKQIAKTIQNVINEINAKGGCPTAAFKIK